MSEAKDTIRVMVVDDEPAVGLVLSGILRAHGYSVRTAASVAEACALFRDWSPRCVVLDMMLTDGSGLEVLEYSSNCEGAKDAVFILLTALGVMDSDVMRGMGLGASACLGKPFDPNELIGKVLEVVS